MLRRLRDLWRRFPNWLRAGINTGWQSTAGALVLSLLGWLRDVQEWFDASVRGDFPSVSPIGKAALAVVVGVASGALTAVYRLLRPGPNYDRPPTRR